MSSRIAIVVGSVVLATVLATTLPALIATVTAPSDGSAGSPGPVTSLAFADPATEVTTPFISFGSEVSYQIAKAPLAGARLGAAAAALADEKVPPPVRGDDSAALPSSWMADGVPKFSRGTSLGTMPLSAKPRRGRCKCATEIGNDAKHRIAALYVEKSFRINDAGDVENISLLELKAIYRDAIIVSLNGREVVRRNIGGDVGSMDTGRRPRGPERESFFIPVTPGLLVQGDNIVRIEVRPSGHRESPTLDFELSARAGEKIIRGPLVARDEQAVTVNFSTDLPVAGRIEWGSSDELGQSTLSAGGELAVNHSIRLPVAADRPLYYRVFAGTDSSKTYRVGVRPRGSEVVRFGVYGDMRGGHRVHSKILRALQKEAPDFVVVTGDLVLRGSDGGDWQRFFSVAKELLATTPYYPAAGNHDMGRSGEERRLMIEQFPLPKGPSSRPAWGSWYSFDIANIHFVMLDSNAYRHKVQLDWLKEDLADAQARGSRAIFASTHNGPYSRGIHKGSRYAATHYAPVLAKHGVTMLFSGHDHLYQRGQVGGLRYIVSGGGGAPLYPVRCGIPGKPRCKARDGMIKAESAYHYVMVQVFGDTARFCPKRPNRDALEKCFKVDLKKR